MKINAKVYVMQRPDGAVKIGHARRPDGRAREISREVEVKFQTPVVREAERIERLAHRLLALEGRRLKPRGEWFTATVEEAVAKIEAAIDMLGGAVALPEWPDPETTAFTMRVDPQFIEQVEELRRLISPIPTKADAVRLAVEEAVARRQRAHAR